MARKTKSGIDYFSHDVDMLQDKKIKLLKAKHGLIGYAVYLRLLEELYRGSGYYLKVDDDFIILFADDNNLTLDVCNLILNDCIDRELFDKKMYKKHKILTSKRIQSNYCSATERRKAVSFIKDYILINVNDLYNTDKINVNIYELNANINGLNDGTGAQSKEKESKEKESKEKERKECIVESIRYLNEKSGKNYKSGSVKTREFITARFNEGFTLTDFKKVIDIKVASWLNDPEMSKFLRPETLFSNKFEGYLNETPVKVKSKWR